MPASRIAIALCPYARSSFCTPAGTDAPQSVTILFICAGEVIGMMPASMRCVMPSARALSRNS